MFLLILLIYLPVKYVVRQFVKFIHDNNDIGESRFGRIEAIVSFLPLPNDQIQDALKISRLLKHSELGIHHSKSRSRQGNNKELWMIEEDCQVIPINNIIKPVSVWLQDLPEPTSYDFYVSEILYRDVATNRMQIWPVNLRHHHPSEYVITLDPSPLQHMKVFKFMIDIYNDDFGTYRNVWEAFIFK